MASKSKKDTQKEIAQNAKQRATLLREIDPPTFPLVKKFFAIGALTVLVIVAASAAVDLYLGQRMLLFVYNAAAEALFSALG